MRRFLPVAIFKAMRNRPGLDVLVEALEVILNPGVACLLGDLGYVDRRFDGFDLAEEQLVLSRAGSFQ